MILRDLPRYLEADDFCGWCEHVFRLDDERIAYQSPSTGAMTICERCAEKFEESNREEVEIMATYAEDEARNAA